MEIEPAPKDSKNPEFDSLFLTVDKAVTDMLKPVGMRRFVARAFTGRSMKTVTLADGSATTEVDLSVGELKQLIARRTP